MKIFIASDHAGPNEKKEIVKYLQGIEGLEVFDLGPSNDDRVNYPDYAKKVVQSVQQYPDARGILICGSGIGMSMVANRFKGIRAALCREIEEAKLSREHNNSNVLCMGARIISFERMKELVAVWLKTEFAQGRHAERIQLFDDLGEEV